MSNPDTHPIMTPRIFFLFLCSFILGPKVGSHMVIILFSHLVSDQNKIGIQTRQSSNSVFGLVGVGDATLSKDALGRFNREVCV